MAARSLVYRQRVLRLIHRARAGHTGGSLSEIDILNVLYNRVLEVAPARVADPTRDRYVQSKGHAAEGLYVVLADLGFIAEDDLASIGKFNSRLAGHPTRKVPGVEMNTGALGHGLSISAGMALGAKKSGADYRVFTLLGDGELCEGSNWEAALFAAHYKLDNLTAIVDRNRLQITGRTADVCRTEPLAEKFAAFGWHVIEVDGHDLGALEAAFVERPSEDRPKVVIANTVKGRGVSFMEDRREWHHRVPSDEELSRALAELDGALHALTAA
jgi:transketolase